MPIRCLGPTFSIQSGASKADAIQPKVGMDHPLLMGGGETLKADALRFRRAILPCFRKITFLFKVK